MSARLGSTPFFLSGLVLVSLSVSACQVTSSNRDGGIAPGTDAPMDARAVAPDAPVPGTVRVEPANYTATLSGTPITIDYHAFYVNGDGSETDITAECAWSVLTPSLGSFTGSTFTSNLSGGYTQIRCTRGTNIGQTTLTLVGTQIIVTTGVPADVPSRFEGVTGTAPAPDFVYPADGVMVPPNLGELEFHYHPGSSQYFELAFESATGSVKIYVGCPESVGTGCIFTPDPMTWSALSASLAGQGVVTYTLRGVDAGGTVTAPATRTIRVAEENITGGLYYWNAGGGSIDRFEFAVRGARAERFLRPADAGGACVGCHSLSRDGSRIAVGTGIPTSTFRVFDVVSRTQLFQVGMGLFPGAPSMSSFGPGSPPTAIATSSTMGIVIRNLTDGTVVEGPFGGGNCTMPDWSNDGNSIVYVSGMAPLDTAFVSNGVIQTLVRTGGTWGAGPTLASGGGNNYYPAFTPDASWVVFGRSPSGMANGGSDGMNDGELWFVPSDASAAARRLDTATLPGDSWAKFDPTSYLDRGADIYWLTWSSPRGFGLRYGDGGGAIQLWMAAFDGSVAESGGDPVLPPFRLPFQDIATGNHIAQWVTSIERRTCSTDVDCGGEFCVDGRCYEQVPDILF